MCRQAQAVSILREVYTVCNPALKNQIEVAFLYGSYARGDFHSESDIDILLTVNLHSADISACRRTVAELVSDLSLEHDITVSVAIKPSEQFWRYSQVSPYYQNVLGEGIRYP